MKSIQFLKDKGVDVDKSLELFGDINTYNDTIGEFLVGIHNKIKNLIDLMNKGDMQNYSIIVHSMKSDCKYFGFMKLANLAYEHEMKSKAGDLYYVTNHINDLIFETNNTIKLIQEYMNGEDEKEVEQLEDVNPDVYNKKTILVVDDSNIIRNFVKRVFSDEYNVGTANDGDEAIKIIKANKDNDFIVTILLDLNMPKVDGFAVLDYMKENKLLKKMPVSIISGDSSKETIDRAFKYEIVDMLEKPFNDQSVKMIIEKTLIYKDMKKD
ncbi:MAG: response regulator [Bacilli bacterium]|nr:response regulator [Bacilli bacterium]MBR2997705.1 response regulator [Bacilli bacterium]